MADILKMITAKRYIEGEERVCYYLGTYQTDGWIYFNDDIFWRHNPEFNVTQLLYLSKEVWCNTDNLEITNIGNLNGTQAQNVINGAGGVAADANVENAVQWAINKVTQNYIEYDWPPRVTSVGDTTATIYDCSSFVITAFIAAGFPVSGASYTGDMVPVFENAGFTFIPGTTWEASDLQRGDIQINITHHTNLYIGNNQDVDCGSTPGRIITHWNFYYNDDANYYGGWDGILRYTG